VDCTHLLIGKVSGAGNQIRVIFIFFAAYAVVSLEGPLIDKAFVIKGLKSLLASAFVSWLCGSDEVLIVNVNRFK